MGVQTIRIGWTRKRPRQIARLTDDGEAGQRARLAGTALSENAWNNTPRMYGVSVDPPSDPTPGVTYGVQKDATGAWGGHGGDLAVWTAATEEDPGYWIFTTPADETQWLFNTVANYYGDAVRLRNCRAWIRQGGQWHGTGDIYEYADGAWTKAADQAAPPDTETTYGRAEAGDFMGPWIWNELQAALKLLHLTKADGCSFGGTSATHSSNHVEWARPWAAAQAAAIAAWTPGNVFRWEDDFEPNDVYAFNQAVYDGYDWKGYGSRDVHQQRASFYNNGGDPALTVDITFYVIGDAYDWSAPTVCTFASFGDPVALGVATAWYAMTGVANGESFTSPQWGQVDAFPAPPWVDPASIPPDQHGGGSTVTGYRIWRIFATKEHARPGGFAYQ